MKKCRVTNELIEKAEKVFKAASVQFISVDRGLDRRELRALERAGIVEKMPTFKKRKYSNVNPPMAYVYRLIKTTEMGGINN